MISDQTRASQDRFLLTAIIIAALSTALMVAGLIGSGPHNHLMATDPPQTIRFELVRVDCGVW